VLFDLYRATGQQPRFESLAIDYAQQFGWSAPQWYSLPKLVADALADERPVAAARARRRSVGWVARAELDIEAVARLRSQTLQMPLPWVFDWSELRRIEAEAAMQLSMLFRLWAGPGAGNALDAGDQLFTVLPGGRPHRRARCRPGLLADGWRRCAWPTGRPVRRSGHRLLRHLRGVAAVLGAGTRCKVRIGGSGAVHAAAACERRQRAPPASSSQPASTTAGGVAGGARRAVGPAGGRHQRHLTKLLNEAGHRPIVSVSCTRLIRVDFIAAGDLLNWVLARRSENRAVHFVDAHRLVALFFGAMGINEHAKVQV
jgi:hypothetical protein